MGGVTPHSNIVWYPELIKCITVQKSSKPCLTYQLHPLVFAQRNGKCTPTQKSAHRCRIAGYLCITAQTWSNRGDRQQVNRHPNNGIFSSRKKSAVQPQGNMKELKSMLLDERSQSDKATPCTIPTAQLSGKGTHVETVKRSRLAGGRDKRWSTGDFGGRETTPYDTIMVDRCRFTFAQTHRIYHTKNESECKPWPLGDTDMSLKAHQCDKHATLVGVQVTGRLSARVRGLWYMGNPCTFHLIFFWRKTAWKNRLLNKRKQNKVWPHGSGFFVFPWISEALLGVT